MGGGTAVNGGQNNDKGVVTKFVNKDELGNVRRIFKQIKEEISRSNVNVIPRLRVEFPKGGGGSFRGARGGGGTRGGRGPPARRSQYRSRSSSLLSYSSPNS